MSLLYSLLNIPGYILFILTGRTPKYLYLLHRQLFVLSGGRVNDLLSKILSTLIKMYNMPKSVGILGELTNEDVDVICSKIEINGYYILPVKLPTAEINALKNYAETNPARILDPNKHAQFTEQEYLFSEINPLSPKYSFKTCKLANEPSVQKIFYDQNLLHIAQNYLKIQPILDDISLWWSVPFKGKGTSAAAQEYHFDMDRLKFLKCFFYLTDVTPTNGPHCYVPRSHKHLPKQLRRDGRFSDYEINKHYDKEIEICGEIGSIILVDTRGMHKGKPLTKGTRLLLQLEFSNSLFGQKYEKCQPTLNKTFKHVSKKYKRTYQLFSNSL